LAGLNKIALIARNILFIFVEFISKFFLSYGCILKFLFYERCSAGGGTLKFYVVWES